MMDPHQESDLVRKARAGDRESYGQLADLYGAAVLAIAYGRIGNYTVSQDIAQDAFLLAFENLGKLRQPERFGRWLKTITINLSKNWLKSQAYRKRLLADSVTLRDRLGYAHPPEIPDKLQQTEMYCLVDEALRDLPARDRESLLLYYFEGQSIAEAARGLDISPAAMKKRLERARKRLRDQMAAHVETGLVEAGKERKMSQRVLAAIPLGASYAKIAPMAAVLPAASLLHLTDLLARTGGVIAGISKTAAVAVAILAIGGASLMIAGNRRAKEGATAPVAVEQSVTSQQQRPDSTDAPQQETMGRNEESASEEAKLADLKAGAAEEPSISGTIRDSDGNPLPGARVEARLGLDLFEALHAAPEIACETKSGDDGSYVITPLPVAKDMVILVTHPDWAIGGGRAEGLAENEQRGDVDFKLDHTETASGIVVDADGHSIEGALVTVGSAAHSAYYDPRRYPRARAAGLTAIVARDCGGLPSVATDADGRFTFTHLPKGSVITWVTARKKGYGLDYAWSRESCEKAERNLRAGKGTPLSGLEFPIPCDNIKIVLKRGGSITGRVVEATTGQPIEGVLVTLEGTIHCPYPYLSPSVSFRSSARTDPSGFYRIDDIPPGSVMAKAKRANSVGEAREVLVHSGEVSEEIDFELALAGAIEGIVYDAESGRPIPDQIIQCFKKGVWGKLPSGRTEAAGKYRVDGLEQGEWQVRPGYHELRLAEFYHPDADERYGITVTVHAGQLTRDVDLYLETVVEEVGKVTGTVTDFARRPIDGATVLIREGLSRAVTDDLGEYGIARVKPGLARLIALDPKSMTYGTAYLNVEASEENVADIEVRDKAASTSGTVLDQQGRPVDIPFKISFETKMEGGEEVRFETQPEDNGSYNSGPLPPGHYMIRGSTSGDGYKSEPREGVRVTLREGDHVSGPDFLVTPMTGFLAGTVLYPDGTPVSGKYVHVGGREGAARDMTDDNGRFRVEKIDGDNLYIQLGQPGRGGREGDPEWLFIRGYTVGTDNVRLVLQPVGILTGRVIASEDHVVGFGINVEGDLGFQDSIRANDATFELPLQPDVYRITIQCVFGLGRGIASGVIEDVVVESDMVTDLGEIQVTETVGTE